MRITRTRAADVVRGALPPAERAKYKREGYWTRKEVARTNFEVVRTLANLGTLILQIAIAGKLFGWW